MEAIGHGVHWEGHAMTLIRPAAVSGSFYPADPNELDRQLTGFLDHISVPAGEPPPKAIIAPHAGYIYSGPIAAAAYARLALARGQIRRVVLIGPSHRVAFRGLALGNAEAWASPLGTIPIDRNAYEALQDLPLVGFLDQAHGPEHSLEVHIPFLIKTLGPIPIIPIVVGDAPAEAVAAVLTALWGGPETAIVVSSDLSHYLDYATCQKTDRETAAAIDALDGAGITRDGACGRVPVAGLLHVARARSMSIHALDLRNSGDTAGPKDRVVGYGAWALYEHPLRAFSDDLVALAKASIDHGLKTGKPLEPPTQGPDLLFAPGAVFVTLKAKGELRGCIGSVSAWRDLGADIVDNAYKAAFNDPRFAPLTPPEWPGVTLSVTVLTPTQPMTIKDEADLIAQLRPGMDGLVIEDGPRRALFIPSVWETLPTPHAFLAHLKAKAGLAPTHWSATFKAWRFQAVELK